MKETKKIMPKQSITVVSPCSRKYLERVTRLVDEEAAKIPFLSPKKKVCVVYDDTEKSAPSFSKILNNWCIFNLADEIDTDFALIVQLDGRIFNPAAWSDEFFNYDYIGNLFQSQENGNGGFCLRSKKLMQACQKLPYKDGWEDHYICKTMRGELEKQGLKFAPVELTAQFGKENQQYVGSFGAHRTLKFHGRTISIGSNDKKTNELYNEIQSLHMKYTPEPIVKADREKPSTPLPKTTGTATQSKTEQKASATTPVGKPIPPDSLRNADKAKRAGYVPTAERNSGNRGKRLPPKNQQQSFRFHYDAYNSSVAGLHARTGGGG